MTDGLEIERKFLVEQPQLDRLSIVRSADIVQTYLVSGEDGSQRRVRRISENGVITYKYTEKIFYTHVTRHEAEREITEEEYEKLLRERDTKLVPVVKTRYRFDHLGQLFELDIYPYSDRLAILELELRDAWQEIIFPDEVKVLKEVSDDHAYSNSALAVRGAFPADAYLCEAGETEN